MKPHYFDQEKAATGDMQLSMAIVQGYVPTGCLLGGATVMSEVMLGNNPCWGCEGPREKCGGQPKKEAQILILIYGVVRLLSFSHLP